MNIILVMVTYSVIYTINRLRGPYMRKKDILELKNVLKRTIVHLQKCVVVMLMVKKIFY